MESIFKYIESNVDKWIENLTEAVAIRSVSTWADTRPEVERMVHWTGTRLQQLGATVEYCDVGLQVP